MDIKQERFLDFLGKTNTRFTIPVFQRVYSWNARQCRELWDDILAAGSFDDPAKNTHFMGMVLYSVDAERWHGATQLNIIDGQQRMTTVSLLLCALARYLDEKQTQVGGLNAHDLAQRYLHVDGVATAAGKLVLSHMDRETLYALAGAGPMPEEPAGRLIDNAELFYSNMQDDSFDASRLWRGLESLQIAGIALAFEDSPQLVFESLNSKGMPLTTADRIRNFIVVTDEANGAEESGVFERCWLPLEHLAAQSQSSLSVTLIVHAWLAAKYREIRIFDKSEVYGIFKNCLREEYGENLTALLGDLSDYAQSLLDDEAFCAEQLEEAQRWVQGKPKDLVSEYKMFGD